MCTGNCSSLDQKTVFVARETGMGVCGVYVVCVCVHVCARMQASMRVYIIVCVCACMHVCVFEATCIYTQLAVCMNQCVVK